MPAKAKKPARKSAAPRSKKSTGLKQGYKLGGKRVSSVVLAFVLFGIVLGGYALLRSFATLGNTSTALPPSDVRLCKNPENPTAGTRYDWVVAPNNKTTLCSLVWASQQAHPQLIDPMGNGQKVYRLSKSRYLVDQNNNLIANPQSTDSVDFGITLNHTLTNKTAASDYVDGDDSAIPVYANGGGLPGYDVTCRNDSGVNNDFKSGENTIRLVVTMYNTGSTTWTPGQYTLAYTPVSENVFGNNPVASLTKSVARGEKFDFNVTLPMPQQNGYYLLNTVMKHGDTPFGAIAVCQLQRFNNGWFDYSGTVAATPTASVSFSLPSSVQANTNIALLVQEQLSKLVPGTSAVIKNGSWQATSNSVTITTTTDVSAMKFPSGNYVVNVKDSSGTTIATKRITVREVPSSNWSK